RGDRELGYSTINTRPGWRNWQTQRTQNLTKGLPREHAESHHVHSAGFFDPIVLAYARGNPPTCFSRGHYLGTERAATLDASRWTQLSFDFPSTVSESAVQYAERLLGGRRLPNGQTAASIAQRFLRV